MEKIFKDNHDGTLNVSVSYARADYQPVLTKVMNKLLENVTVKGFRKGKAPRDLAMRYVSNEDLYNGMVNKIIDRDFPTLLDGFDKPEDVANVQPTLSVDYDQKNDIYNFLYVFVKFPEAEIKKCSGFDVKEDVKVATEDDVNTEVNRLLKDGAELVPSQEEACNDDHVTIDFTGYVDNKEFDGGSAQDYDLVLGSHSFVPGFEEALVGIKEGEKRTIEVTFPENYLASLANKKAKFAVLCKGVKKVVLPELNEEFIASLNDYKDCKSVEEFKKAVEEKLNANFKTNARNAKLNKVFDLVKENSNIIVNDKYVELVSNQIQQNQLNQFKQYGLNLDEYLKLTGLTLDQFNENSLKQAKVEVEKYAIIRGLQNTLNIECTQEELEAKFGGKEKFDEIMKAAEEQRKKNPSFNVDGYISNVKDSVISEKINEYLLNNN